VLLLDCCYKAVAYSVRDICEPAGGQLSFASVPFPGTTEDGILSSLDEALRKSKPRFALLDHVTSQPAIVLPIRAMVSLCRQHGVEEVAIDGAHSVGLLPPALVDVPGVGADFYYSNLHKWAFAPSTVTALFATPWAMGSTAHVVPSWHAGGGLVRESRWPGTRDFAPFLSVPTALTYLDTWRSVDGLRCSAKLGAWDLPSRIPRLPARVWVWCVCRPRSTCRPTLQASPAPGCVRGCGSAMASRQLWAALATKAASSDSATACTPRMPTSLGCATPLPSSQR